MLFKGFPWVVVPIPVPIVKSFPRLENLPNYDTLLIVCRYGGVLLYVGELDDCLLIT